MLTSRRSNYASIAWCYANVTLNVVMKRYAFYRKEPANRKRSRNGHGLVHPNGRSRSSDNKLPYADQKAQRPGFGLVPDDIEPKPEELEKLATEVETAPQLVHLAPTDLSGLEEDPIRVYLRQIRRG